MRDAVGFGKGMLRLEGCARMVVPPPFLPPAAILSVSKLSLTAVLVLSLVAASAYGGARGSR